MGLPIFIVDAFTDKPFAGNPAAVCLLPIPPTEAWMQQFAAEMNFAETAFLVPETDGYDLRWFTPAVEVVLCGHATLASAHILWETGRLKPTEQARFHTRSGLLTVERGQWNMTMNFPALSTEPRREWDDLPAALGVKATFIGGNKMDALVEVENEQAVRYAWPDFALLAKHPVRGVIVTAGADNPSYDFVSRFFAPRSGVPEDPVTGSAHCCLGPYWAERLNKRDLVGYQASARGGMVRVGVRGDRVHLGGQAVTILRGELGEAASRSAAGGERSEARLEKVG
ncbi:MAG: PhzF family phenazine biosynthesis protein [Planctomycetes bacterium]|nr:PhzF family phenazine biosynthesis protein [Planctomycetota bacterium]